MTKEAVNRVFTLAIVNQLFRERFEDPKTREEALREYNYLWMANGGLADEEFDILVKSKGTKLSDISLDFDAKNYYEDP